MSFGSEKKETKHAFSFFLSKVPVHEPPPGFPTGPLWKQLPIYKAFFYMSLKFLIKISLNKDIFSFLSKAPGKELPPMFPKSGAPMETDAHFYSLT